MIVACYSPKLVNHTTGEAVVKFNDDNYPAVDRGSLINHIHIISRVFNSPSDNVWIIPGTEG